MSNQSIIFAIAKETNQGAMSVNGSTWQESNVASTNSYKGLGGIAGKFIYLTYDPLRKYSVNDYAIIDNINWKPGVMLSEQSPCIIAIAENATTLFYSYSGDTFLKGPESV